MKESPVRKIGQGFFLLRPGGVLTLFEMTVRSGCSPAGSNARLESGAHSHRAIRPPQGNTQKVLPSRSCKLSDLPFCHPWGGGIRCCRDARNIANLSPRSLLTALFLTHRHSAGASALFVTLAQIAEYFLRGLTFAGSLYSPAWPEPSPPFSPASRSRGRRPAGRRAHEAAGSSSNPSAYAFRQRCP